MSLVRLKHKMRRAIRPFMWLFAVIFFVSCFTLYGSYTYSKVQQSAPVAKVNGADISDQEFKNSVQRIENMFGRQGGLETQWMAYKYGFDSVVDEYLRQQAAEKMGLSVQRRDAEDARDADIDAQLKQIGEGLTGTQLEEERDRLASMPENSVDAKMRMLLSQRLDDRLKGMARPVELRASEIVIKNEKRTPQQARAKADEIYEKATAPRADFAALARALSEDNTTKNKGGDLDWLKPASALDPEILATAFQMKKGQVSQPVPTNDGWAVLKITDERPYVSTKKDPKQQKDDVDSYKSQVAQAISTGFYASLKREARIDAVSPMVKGLLAEEAAGPGGMLSETTPQGKAKLQEAASAYEEALKKEPQLPPNFVFHLGQIYSRLGQYDKAIGTYRQVLERVSSTEVHMALGNALEKKGDKAGAIAEYQEASKNAYDQPSIHGELTSKFRTLGRPDLAKLEDAKNQAYLKDQREEQARKQAEQKRMLDLQKKAAAEAKKKAPLSAAGTKTGATGTASPGIKVTTIPPPLPASRAPAPAPAGAKTPAPPAAPTSGKSSAPVSATPK